jgi:hypothetical protein
MAAVSEHLHIEVFTIMTKSLAPAPLDFDAIAVKHI